MVGVGEYEWYLWAEHARGACPALISITALLPWLERVWWLLQLAVLLSVTREE